MKRVVLTALALMIAGGLGAFLFAWSGLYNVGARAGHWPITEWFLHFGLRNSIETHAMGVTPPPPLDEPALIHAGLGHYEGACAPCHGEPGQARNPVADHLLPKPPYLPETIREWTPEQLFWIVSNGLKYTGMPSWPAERRDDEAWAVVAALLRLPELTAAEYRELLRADTAQAAEDVEQTAMAIAAAGPVGQSLVACGRCHGLRGGGGGGGAFPRLSGQGEAYLFESLRAYAMGARPSGIMQPIAGELTEDEMRRLAAFYAAEGDAAFPAPPQAEPRLVELGAAIAERGVPEQRIPPCVSCHGPDGAARHPLYPSLDGQFAYYIGQQLRLWRSGGHGGTPQAQVMDAVVHTLTDEQIQAVSLYFAARRPEGR